MDDVLSIQTLHLEDLLVLMNEYVKYLYYIVKMDCTYALVHAMNVTNDTIAECAKNFSQHYGVWGNVSPYKGEPVKLTQQRLRNEYLFSEDAFIITAKIGDRLVGHILACRFVYESLHGTSKLLNKISNYYSNTNNSIGTVIWITQLVVHTEFRNKRIATRLIQLAFNPERDVVCGLVSSHPHAVRAFERATNMKVDPVVIATCDVKSLLEKSRVPYLQDREIRIGLNESVIVTDYYVDHTHVNAELKLQQKWNLGTIRDGEEFLALVIRDSNANSALTRWSSSIIVMLLTLYLQRLKNQIFLR
jgi:Acetyltransferase (GNAT) family